MGLEKKTMMTDPARTSRRTLALIAIMQSIFVLALFLPALEFKQSTIYTSGTFRPVAGWFAFIGSILMWAPLFEPPKDFVFSWAYLIVLTYLPCNLALTLWPLGVLPRLRFLPYLFGPILLLGCFTAPCVFLSPSVPELVFENTIKNPHIAYFLWITSIVFSAMANGFLIYSRQDCRHAKCANKTTHPGGISAAS